MRGTSRGQVLRFAIKSGDDSLCFACLGETLVVLTGAVRTLFIALQHPMSRISEMVSNSWPWNFKTRRGPCMCLSGWGSGSDITFWLPLLIESPFGAVTPAS